MTIAVGDLSPSEALKMFEADGLGDNPVDEPKAEPAPAEPAKVEPKAEPEPPKQEVEPEPEGVATRDGKHVIPYSVLQSERTRAAAAERELQEARAQLAALEKAATEPKPTANNGEPADTPEQSQEDADRLALLEEDFPTVAAELKAMRELVKKLDAQIKPLQQTTQDAEQQRANEAAMTVQEAIDSVPKMAHIQAADPEAFELAKQFDSTLRESAAWANRPMAERFAKVVELVEASRGAIDIPGQAKPSTDPAALRKAAEERLAAAAKAVPTSLSHFPAGTPAATDELGALEQMSTQQLAAKLGGMSAAQLDAYYASL